MKRKHIDAARETRLWLRDVVLPLATVVGGALTIPECREWVGQKFRKLKDCTKKEK